MSMSRPVSLRATFAPDGKCEVAHTCYGIDKLLMAPLPAARLGALHYGGRISKTNLSSRTVPRVELDHRSREARLRFERIASVHTACYSDAFPAATTTLFFRARKIQRAAARGGDKKLLSDRGPSGLPIILGLLLENTELYNSSGVFNF